MNYLGFIVFYWFYDIGNSGCVNSGYGDMRYNVYMRISILDYPLDVLIS